MLFGKNKSKLQEWKEATAKNELKKEELPQTIPKEETPIAKPNETPIEPIVNTPPVEQEPKKVEPELPKVEKPTEKISAKVNNPTIDIFSILVKYHEEMIKAVAKYDGIIAELIKLSGESANEGEKEQESTPKN